MYTTWIYTILNPNVDKYARGFFVVPRRSPAGLLVASQGDSTQAQRKRRRRIVYIWVENSISLQGRWRLEQVENALFSIAMVLYFCDATVPTF